VGNSIAIIGKRRASVAAARSTVGSLLFGKRFAVTITSSKIACCAVIDPGKPDVIAAGNTNTSTGTTGAGGGVAGVGAGGGRSASTTISGRIVSVSCGAGSGALFHGRFAK